MNQNRRRRGFSLIELMIVIAIILIIATIALPKLNRAKMYAHETAAIKTLQTIHTAQTQYQSQFGRFATSLTELGPPQSGQPGPQSADLIDSSLALGEKSGYKFAVTGNQSGYVISAVPVAYNSTGSRSFYSDQTMQIRQNYGPEPATAQSPEMRN
jgi:prepilin-type N-terminal cleavage/methylation domain-containing protein